MNDRGTNYLNLPLKEGSGPSQLERRDKTASVTVKGQTVGVPRNCCAQLEELTTMEKPVGVNYIWGGDQENQSEGFGTLGFALLAAIILVSCDGRIIR
jgi:HAE1 family hydrophobic/amphiphilic exporter-1